MTDPENFLSRWSRKKRDAVDEPTPAPPAEEAAADASPPVEAADKLVDNPLATSPSESAFDPASLPSLDSIGARTDIRGFLQPGVPPDLTRAALRRAWTADPAIRDFKGLQENDWDFNDPKSMFGFGELGPDFDLKRMLASVFGETPKEEATPPAADDVDRKLLPLTDEMAATDDRPAPDRVELLPTVRNAADARKSADAQSFDATADTAEVVQRNANVALHDDDTNTSTKGGKRPRSHGGALPR